MIIDYKNMTDEELTIALNYINGEILRRKQVHTKELWNKVVDAIREYVTFAEPILIETWDNTYSLCDPEHRLRTQGTINFEDYNNLVLY